MLPPILGEAYGTKVANEKIPSRRETNGKLHGGIFRMNFSIARADDEFRLRPRLTAHPFRQIFRAHQAKQTDERRIAFTKNDRTFANNDEAGVAGTSLHARELRGFMRKDAGK